MAAEDTVIPSIWNILSKNAGVKAMEKDEVVEENKNYLKSTLVPTGIKAYMPENEYLMLVNRSSNPLKIIYHCQMGLVLLMLIIMEMKAMKERFCSIN